MFNAVAIDVETSKKPNFLPWIPGSYLHLISLARSDGVVKSWLLNHAEATKSIRQVVEEVQAELNAADVIIAHNAKFDLNWLRHIGLVFENLSVYCTQVAEYVLSGHDKQDGLSLDDLCRKRGLTPKIDKVKLYWDSGYETDQIPTAILIPYCEQDAINALALYQRQTVEIQELGLVPLVSLEMETLKILAQMEYNGMLLDQQKLMQYSDDYGTTLENLDEELKGLLGIDNPGSAQQLSSGLFGGTYAVDGVEETRRVLKSGEVRIGTRKCKVDKVCAGVGFIPPPRSETKTKGVYQTSTDILPLLKAKTPIQKRVLELLFERSRVAQLRGTYFEGLQKRIQDSGKVHPSINQTITRTGRLSCSQPNLQNLPRGATGPVKQCVISRFSHEG